MQTISSNYTKIFDKIYLLLYIAILKISEGISVFIFGYKLFILKKSKAKIFKIFFYIM